MPMFVNTSDEEAKYLLGGRFHAYLEENGVFDSQDGIYEGAVKKFKKDDQITQFIRDVGHAYHTAYNPSIVTMHLLEKDGVKYCHNNWYKSRIVATDLGLEYLHLLAAYGLFTFNPSIKLDYVQNMNGLRMVIDRPIELVENNHSNGLDAFFAVPNSPITKAFTGLTSIFRDNVTYAYLKSMLMSNDEASRMHFFATRGDEDFLRPLGIVDGDFSTQTLRASEQALRALCASSEDYSSQTQQKTTLALSLTTLPGHALILKGEDPHEVFEVIKSRATIALTTQHSKAIDVELEATAIAKQVFLPFPSFWEGMSINPNEYLGLPFDQLDAQKRTSNRTQQIGTLFMAETQMHPGKVLDVISYNNQCFDFTFGDDYFLRPAAKPQAFLNRQITQEQFSRLIDALIAADGVTYSPFIQDAQLLTETDPHSLSALAVKAAIDPDSNTGDLLQWISQYNTKAVDIAFETLLDSGHGTDTLALLLQHRTPPAEIIKRLPRHLRGKVLESGLGL